MRPPPRVELSPLPTFAPDLFHRAWSSMPHPTLPLIATAHDKSVTVFSLSTLSAHSSLTGGHSRSVRCVAWKPGLPPHRLCLVSGSFDSTAGLWRRESDGPLDADVDSGAAWVDLATGTSGDRHRRRRRSGQGCESGQSDGGSDAGDEWEFTLVLEGHENEIKSVAFSPSGQYLATCSRDKSIWIWEDVGANEGDDDWETVAVLSEHQGDVKCVAWCPAVPGRSGAGRYGADVLASASYDDTVRVWREDHDGEWACVAVLEGHTSTVWGVQWEQRPRPGDRFPRLMTFSADATARIWTLEEPGRINGREDDSASSPPGRPAFGGIPNTMRRPTHEDWRCTAVLPKVHSRDIYSASWSKTGLVASTGSDGIVAVYTEDDDGEGYPEEAEAHAGAVPERGQPPASNSNSGPEWRLVGSVTDAHGPYEINHVAWCTRFDPGAKRRGLEEMLVTTGDDGLVRPWRVDVQVETGWG